MWCRGARRQKEIREKIKDPDKIETMSRLEAQRDRLERELEEVTALIAAFMKHPEYLDHCDNLRFHLNDD